MKQLCTRIAASLDCADYLNVLGDIRSLEEGGVEMLHIDIMDGNFVPNYAIGTNLLKKLRPQTDLLFDVHLMVNNTEQAVEIFSNLGADMITFHLETSSRLHHVIHSIKEKGKKVGLALNPSTSPAGLEYLEPYLDLVLVMTVEPGFVGQKFIPEMVEKVRAIREIIEHGGGTTEIAVDGGIGEKTVPLLKEAGANIFVGGTSSIFSGRESVSEAARRFRQLCEGG